MTSVRPISVMELKLTLLFFFDHTNNYFVKNYSHLLLTPLLREFQYSISFHSLSTCTSHAQYKKISIVLRKNVIYIISLS